MGFIHLNNTHLTAHHLGHTVLENVLFLEQFSWCLVSQAVHRLQACNTCGQVGYVPESYLQILRPPAEGSAACTVSGSPWLDSSLNSSKSLPGVSTRGQESPGHTVGQFSTSAAISFNHISSLRCGGQIKGIAWAKCVSFRKSTHLI